MKKSLNSLTKNIYNENIKIFDRLIKKTETTIIFMHSMTETFQCLRFALEKMLKENKNIKEVGICYNSINYLKMLQNNIFIYEAIEDGHLNISPIPVSSSLIIEELIKDYKQMCDISGIDIKFSYQKNLYIYVDPYLLKIVFNNIIKNVLEYGGDSFYVRLYESMEKFHIEMSDNGDGIENRILKGFYSDKPISDFMGKKGLGLCITKELIKRNNGTVDILSSKNEGTKFIIKFPLYNPDIKK